MDSSSVGWDAERDPVIRTRANVGSGPRQLRQLGAEPPLEVS